ncbi:hypothetical protein ABZX95_41495 [Streptomyces sp. NPDC004232]|uniref:hypothetical protein n=1 Tax=Streptomyces sp. NPDC004232 TaxID=3154454 RepID=UPI0033AFBA31
MVVASGYEQDGRAVRADAGEFEQLRAVGLDDRRDPTGERGGLGGELLDAVGQQIQGLVHRARLRVQGGACLEQRRVREADKGLAQLRWLTTAPR